MPAKAQPVRVKSSLGEDLLFKAMDLSEELGRMFHCELELLSPKENIELDDLLGHDMTVEIDLPNGSKRHVHGFVTEMAQTGRHGKYATYSLTLRPWLWFLTRTADCRIFQNLKAPDIIKNVFRDNGFSDFKESLSASYRQWEYCVQYRETDFNFVSRLMEQEGIYYFFEEVDGKHVLVLADSPGAHSPIKGYEKIPYYPPSDNVNREEHVSDWTLTKSVNTGKYGLGAFHFKKPKTKLEVYNSIAHSHPRADAEFFDYPGEHYEVAEGNRYVKVRMEELAAQHETVEGDTDAMGLFFGRPLQARQISASRSEPRIPHRERASPVHHRRLRDAGRRRGHRLRLPLRGRSERRAFPHPAHHTQAVDAGPADRDRRGCVRRGDRHRRVRPREGSVPLGPAR